MENACDSTACATSGSSPLHAQFARPQGFLGKIAGLIMTYRPSNRQRNQWVVSLLGLQPTDQVLEIGFGPGLALQHASAQTPTGCVFGLEHSQTMLKAAARRNAREIKNQRVRLFLGSAEEIPDMHQSFDKIFSVNVVQFLPEPAVVFRNLKRLLAPGGKLAMAYQPRSKNATHYDAIVFAQRTAIAMKKAGFKRVFTEEHFIKPVTAVCVIGCQDDPDARA